MTEPNETTDPTPEPAPAEAPAAAATATEPVSFGAVFAALFIGTALIVGALLINSKRPAKETAKASGKLVKATGQCASCHRRETPAVVHQYETSRHAAEGINCLQCHQPGDGQEGVSHNGFQIAKQMTSLNCKRCHASEYEQFERSRHGLPAYAAVEGVKGASPEQIALAEKYHPGMVKRPPNALANLEGPGAKAKGCVSCHSIGRPNLDGSIGSCTACHSRHAASIALARQPETCGQCHMGPDHSQLEIYNESKHGVLFKHQKKHMNLDADPKALTTADMPIPTCATCHMSGLEGMNVTHDTTERLSWYLYAPISKKRPNYQRGQDAMKQVCLKCHARSGVEKFYREAEIVVASTNVKVKKIQDLMKSLRAEKLLTPQPFDEPIEFLDFDHWHYFGRTAKHGAFMGGADFVQWHGNYELLKLGVEIEEMAHEIRKTKKKHK